MGCSIKGWPEGHPQLVTIDGYPFGYATLQCPDPTSEESKVERDGYAASFKALYINSCISICIVTGSEPHT